jgi:hypothetical protein
MEDFFVRKVIRAAECLIDSETVHIRTYGDVYYFY